MLIISRSSDIDLKKILKYPLSSTSLPPANADGTTEKTVKSKLLHAVEQDAKYAPVEMTQIAECSALVIDVVAFIQSLPQSTISPTDPIHFGWTVEDDGQYGIVWATGKIAPAEALKSKTTVCMQKEWLLRHCMWM